MKGKLMIALAVLALVFGLGLASCDNGLHPKDPYTNDPDKEALEFYSSPPTEKDDVNDALVKWH
jgi:hypothetical protein